MNIFIAGCGKLGTALGLRLVMKGHRVVGCRRHTASLSSSFEIIRADVAELAAQVKRLPRMDIVLVSAYPNFSPYTANPIPPCIETIKTFWPQAHIIYTSSTQVYGHADGATVDETTPTDSSPLASAFKQAETAVAQVCSSLVLRIGQILRTEEIPRQNLTGKSIAGDLKRWLNYIHINDLLKVLEAACENTDLRGCYNCTSPQAMTITDWYRFRFGQDVEITSNGHPAANRLVSSDKIRSALPSIQWHDHLGQPIPLVGQT